MENEKQSYEERIKILKERGIDTNLLPSGWCIDCVHSAEIVKHGFMGICSTGCNGNRPFNIIRTEGGLLFEPVDGKTIRGIDGTKPLRYEKEEGVEIDYESE